MARIFKEEDFTAKREKILDFALSLVYSKGYEQMTIQDILDGLQISRGALYHYFDSKKAILEALVDRLGKEAEETIQPILEDSSLSALQKFHRYFETSARWKHMEKDLIVSLLPMWFSDENAFIRQKMTTAALTHTSRLLEPMIRQGIKEKVFTTRFPEQAAVIITGVFLNLGDTLVGLTFAPDRASVQKFETILEAYIDSIERILGAPPGSLKVFEANDFKDWFVASQPEIASE